MKITGILEAINSKADIYGNRYWALRYTDVETGKTVVGTTMGGESNIYSILHGWDKEKPKDWDRSVTFRTIELPIRVFNNLTKGWPHARSSSEDLAEFIRTELKK